jgi:tRNA (mo5U34)-methyltransferase
MTSPEDLQAQADALHWYHTIDLGNGVVTKGSSHQDHGTAILPQVAGRSVLDIGAWDGKYSFLAERAGASRIVALDHYAWGVDWVARGNYWTQCIEQGTLPDHSRDETEFWQPDLPGRRGFDLAAAALGSKVEPLLADFQTVDLDEVGQFDVVLYLGVLYHMKEPLTCLERLRRVTKEVAVIETEAVHLEGFDDAPLLQFYAGSSLRADFGNWYVPTIEALHNLCRAAGFSEVRTIIGPPKAAAVQPPPAPLKVKIGRRLAGVAPVAPSVPSASYRAVVHATA